METKGERSPLPLCACSSSSPCCPGSGSSRWPPAMSFRDCYQQCHPWCRHTTTWLCNVNCDGGDRDDTLAACTMVCSTDSVCGLSEVAPDDAGGVEDCVLNATRGGAITNAK